MTTTLPSWTPLLQDLLELDRAGALAGIRAIIAERLRQVREDLIRDAVPHRMAGTALGHGEYARAAALLAAEIDRQQENQSRTVS